MTNTIKIKEDITNNVITDHNVSSGTYIINNYLTNRSRYTTTDDVPSLSFFRIFNKNFTNRFRKSLFLGTDIQEQFYNQHNTSQHKFQNFNHCYAFFLPQADITYTDDQFGDHLITLKSNYSSSIGYPTVNQITSLIDSTNTYFQQYGNPDARPFYKRELSFNFSYINFRSKGLFDSFVTYVNLGSLRNALVDSIIYDGAGRAANYSINVPDAKYLKTKTEFYKAVKMNKNQLQVNGSTVFTESVQPQYINGLVTHVKNFYNENVLNLLYTLGHTFALKASQFFSWYRSDQFGANNAQLRNSVQRTIVSGSMNVPGQITFSSNITFNKITSSYVPPSTFNIWNASVTYRFLKGNKGEIKFSALDLLRQNKSVINYGAGNTLTIGNVNVLKQYYILTLAFYPRKFGRNGNQ